jgi:hypothetical protein
MEPQYRWNWITAVFADSSNLSRTSKFNAKFHFLYSQVEQQGDFDKVFFNLETFFLM